MKPWQLATEEFQIHQTARGADIHLQLNNQYHIDLEGRPQELTTTLCRQGVIEPEIAFVKASHQARSTPTGKLKRHFPLEDV